MFAPLEVALAAAEIKCPPGPPTLAETMDASAAVALGKCSRNGFVDTIRALSLTPRYWDESFDGTFFLLPPPSI